MLTTVLTKSDEKVEKRLRTEGKTDEKEQKRSRKEQKRA